MPDFVCSVCGNKMSRDLSVVVPHTKIHIVEVIKKKHPELVEEKGICRKCYEYFKKQLHPE